MRWLVVYDGGDEVRATQNVNTTLQQALSHELCPNKELNETVPEIIEIEICILQLRLEEFPLDDYLGEMEQATAHDLAQVSELLQQYQPHTQNVAPTIKILRGQEKEAANLIAEEARAWKAERIYLPLEGACWQCQDLDVIEHHSFKTVLSGWGQRL